MYLFESALVTSASDLTAASDCEFAFLRVLDDRLRRAKLPEKKNDPMLERTGDLGNKHEKRLLARYREQHGTAMVEFPDERSSGLARERAAETHRALLSGAPVVYQGVFYDETDPALPFVGYADFLVLQPDGRYRVVDTKLARRVKVTALLQLAAYHEQLQRLGVPVDDIVELILGTEQSQEVHIDDIAPVFRMRRARMHAIIAEHRAESGPVAWGDPRYAIDGRCELCEEPAAEADDLITVAGMRLTQRAKLIDGGITTLTGLATAPARPAGCDIPNPTFEKLQLQAQLQRGVDPSDKHAVPPFMVIDARPIAGLPAPSPGDLFFDFEGDPLHSEQLPDGSWRFGLDYLFGWVDANGDFDCEWAHSQQEEREALIRFLDFVTERLQQHPDLHIYHYASYEKTHLLSIAARHGVGEAIVDELLRRGVLVDLYPIVTASLRVGAPSYSIKKLEPLYMGEDEREGVASGADSIEQYVAYAALRDAGETEQAQRILDDIRQYNAYDCRSTLKLRDWLRELPEAQQLSLQLEDVEQPVFDFEPSPLDAALQGLAADAEPAEAGAYRLAAAAVDYFKREQKSFWWEHYHRLEQPAELWQDGRGVLVIEQAELERDWHREGRQRTDRRWLRLRGTWAPGSGSPRPGGDVFLLYPEPLPYPAKGHRPGQRLARGVRIHDDPEFITEDGSVVIVETCPADAEPWTALPSHLAPGPPPKTGNLEIAIEEWGQTLLDAAPGWPEDAMTSLLLRRPPARLEPMRDADDSVRAVVASLREMDRGWLAVQGPPGTGKTYLAAHVISELIEQHQWRIGVTAQSHKVIENVLDAVALDTPLDHDLVGKVPSEEGKSVNYVDLPKDGQASFAVSRETTGYVLGGTVWDMTHRSRVGEGQFDLLVIDEAGQFSLAATIAAASSAQRILLLGDPQQLPQVSQGIHPAPVDGSALGHVIGEHAVLPEQFGYFLAESRRMDPAVTAPVSRLAYEGQLRSHPTTLGRSLDGVSPGLHTVPVEHEDNATESPEEAAVVVGLVSRHLGLPWRSAPDAAPTPLDPDDLIVVTPYNAQVETIRAALDAAGHRRVQVGTVDKFQGREAVIAIVSLAASSSVDVPRGMDFLLSRNRLNVSLSRAKWAAYLVHSPALVDYLPHTPDGLATLSAFIRLVEGPNS